MNELYVFRNPQKYSAAKGVYYFLISADREKEIFVVSTTGYYDKTRVFCSGDYKKELIKAGN